MSHLEAAKAVQQGAESNLYVTMAANAAAQIAAKRGLDHDRFVGVFLRLIQQESSFNPQAYNEASGASGIAQIMPNYHPGVNPFNPIEALPYAANYLADNIQRYGGDYLRGTAAYNAGPGTIDRSAGLPDNEFISSLFPETRAYVSNIIGITPPSVGSAGARPMSRPQQAPDDGLPAGDGGTPIDPGGGAGPSIVQGPDGREYVVTPDPSDPSGYRLIPLGGQDTEAPRSPMQQIFDDFTRESVLNTLPPTQYQRAGLDIDRGNLGARYAELGFSREQLAEQQRQNAFNRILDMIDQQRQQQALAEAQRNAARETMLAAGPNATAGRDYFAGFEPFGAAAAVSNFAGVPYTPRSTAGAQVPLNISAAPAPRDPVVQAIIDRYVQGA